MVDEKVVAALLVVFICIIRFMSYWMRAAASFRHSYRTSPTYLCGQYRKCIALTAALTAHGGPPTLPALSHLSFHSLCIVICHTLQTIAAQTLQSARTCEYLILLSSFLTPDRRVMYSRPVPPVNYIQPRWTAPISFANGATYRLYITAVPLLYSLIALLCLTLPAPTIAATTATTLAGCPVEQCVTSYSPNVDYYPIKDPSAQPDWTVLYFPSYKVIINKLATGTETYLLYKCGTPMPVNATGMAAFDASSMVALDSSLDGIVTSATKYFSSPVQTIGIDSGAGTVAVTYLELLGARTQLRYTDSYTVTDITSPCVNALITAGNITATTWNTTTAPLVSLLIEGNTPSQYNNSISLAATADGTVLQRAGWVKLMGVVLDKEEAALGLYNQMQYNYEQLSETVVAAMAGPVAPVVAWVDWSSYSGVWSIIRSTYRESLVTDVGAIVYNRVNTTTNYMNATAFKAALTGVDILIDETYYYTPTNNYTLICTSLGFTAADIASGLYPFLTNSSVWRWDARLSYDTDGDDWYESAIAEPDAVLADFTRVVAPFTTTPVTTPFTATGTYLWLRNVALNQSYYDVPLMCPSTTAPTLPLYSYWPMVNASSLPSFSCAAYLSDAALFGGGLSLTGCGVLQCVSGGGWMAGMDYFPVKETSYGREWSVLYFSSYKVIINNLTSGVETYLLYMCGTPVPVNASSTAGFNASSMVELDSSLAGIVTSATKYFSVPVQRVAVDGNTLGSVGTIYLELLGERTSIAYLDTTTIVSPCIEYLGLLDVIQPLPYYGSEYGYDEAAADLTLYGNTPSYLSNGVSMAVTAAVDDVTGYASWLKFVALFFNKEATASLLFNTTTANIAALTAAATAATIISGRRTVVWVTSYTDYTSGLPVYEVEQTTYRDALVTAAGGTPWPVTAGGVVTGNVTAFKSLLVGADVLIDETYYYTPTTNYTLIMNTLGFTSADIASGLYPFLGNSSVWRNDARVGYDSSDDWYESAIAEPDAVIADMLRLTVPAVSTPIASASSGYLWFRNVAHGEPVNVLASPYTCADPSAPAIPLLQQLQQQNGTSGYGGYVCPAFLLDPMAGVPSQLQLYNLSGGGGAVAGSSSSTGVVTPSSSGGGTGSSSGSSSVNRNVSGSSSGSGSSSSSITRSSSGSLGSSSGTSSGRVASSSSSIGSSTGGVSSSSLGNSGGVSGGG